MDQIEGIPLWEFIKPSAKNRIYEIAYLLCFYADYQDQINQNQEALDLFLTELLYAGFDCLISENLITGATILNEFNIPMGSPLFNFTKLLEEYYSETNNRIAITKQILKTFPIVFCTRIGRDLQPNRNWFVKRERDLKTDPKKFSIKPLSRKDLDLNRRDSDLPNSIKKSSKLFEEQFSKKYPQLSLEKLKDDLVQNAIRGSTRLAKQVNNLPKISRLAGELTGLIRIKPRLKRKPGQEKGAIRDGNYYNYKKGRKEYENLLKIVQDVKNKVKEIEAKKDKAVSEEELLSFFGGSISELELTFIDLDTPPAESAFAIWQSRNPHVADSLRTFRRRFPRKKY